MDVTRAAVFFRNVNLGRPPSPTRLVLERAFLDAGAASATSFLTNGTVVLDASEPRHVLERALRLLARRTGLAEPAFLRSMRTLERLVAIDRFSRSRDGVFACAVTFLAPQTRVPRAAPRTTPRKDVEIISFTSHEVFSVSRVVGRSPGSPNAFLERLLSAPATTRNWSTVTRLVAKFGKAS